MYVRVGLLGNGEKMRGLFLALPARVDLYHGRSIERIDFGEGICGDQNDTGVCVDFLLAVAQLNGLKDYYTCQLADTSEFRLKLTSRLVQVREVCEIIASFQHFGIHERWQRGFALVIKFAQSSQRSLNGPSLEVHVSVQGK
jgi:hypothetical protein